MDVCDIARQKTQVIFQRPEVSKSALIVLTRQRGDDEKMCVSEAMPSFAWFLFILHFFLAADLIRYGLSKETIDSVLSSGKDELSWYFLDIYTFVDTDHLQATLTLFASYFHLQWRPLLKT